jgi:hypothetical protein
MAQLVAGGWLSEDNRAFYNVRDSIDYHVKRQGRQKKLLREMNDLIGLHGWSDDRFEPVA